MSEINTLYTQKNLWIEFFHIPTGNMVRFKSWVTQFVDNFSSEWNKEKVYGRNDPIATFQGTSRSIKLAWEVLAENVDEARDNIDKVERLIQFLYPTYSVTNQQFNATSIASSPLLKLRFVNLIQDVSSGHSVGALAGESGLVGFIDGNFSVTPVGDDTWFDMPDGNLFPVHWKLSCNFIVLHTHPLGWNRDGQSRRGNFPYGRPVFKTVSQTAGDELGGTPDETQQANEQDILGGGGGISLPF